MKQILIMCILVFTSMHITAQQMPHFFKVGTRWIFALVVPRDGFQYSRDPVQIDATRELEINGTQYVELVYSRLENRVITPFTEVYVRYDSVNQVLYALRDSIETIQYAGDRKDSFFFSLPFEFQPYKQVSDIPKAEYFETIGRNSYNWVDAEQNSCYIDTVITELTLAGDIEVSKIGGFLKFNVVVNKDYIELKPNTVAPISYFVAVYMRNANISPDCFYISQYIDFNSNLDISNLVFTSISEIQDIEQPILSRVSESHIQIQNKSVAIQNIRVLNTLGQVVHTHSGVQAQSATQIRVDNYQMYVLECVFEDGRVWRTKVL